MQKNEARIFCLLQKLPHTTKRGAFGPQMSMSAQVHIIASQEHEWSCSYSKQHVEAAVKIILGPQGR